ncbi:hypothetical protein [Halosimplex halophilum]|uniref:hypothetical protein n=1 Tax=Halosimplex halophilum TaxID=2559572 RepID=UPI001AE66E84|nr:hypothetical protein [Halosimplex halophilum]
MEDALEQAGLAGFDIENVEENPHAAGEATYLNVDYDQWNFSFVFASEDDREPGQPLLRVDCGDTIYPSEADSSSAYRELMDGLFELLCRGAVALDVDYAALFNPESRNSIAHDRPFIDGIEEFPRLGVYSGELVDEFGGVDSMFDPDPWYTATLAGDKFVVADAPSDWLGGPWQPPTEAEYLDHAEFVDREDSGQAVGLSDPFANLDAGEYGADVGVEPDDISGEFTNDALRLRRVRVDDERNLRRVDDDAFVRNVVDKKHDDQLDLIQAMLAEIPREPHTDEHASALLHEAIPPSFVRLDGPDDENVVTKVMNLDTDVSKHDLLISLGRVAQQDDFTDDDLDSIEDALDTLDELDGENVDTYIRQNLL